MGDIDFGIINNIATDFNKGELKLEKETLLGHKEEPLISESDDLLDIDWANPKQEIEIPAKKEIINTNNNLDDDLLGVDIIEEVKPIKQQTKDVDIDLFGDEEPVYQKPKIKVEPDDLFGDEEPVYQKPKATEEPDDLFDFNDETPTMVSQPTVIEPVDQPVESNTKNDIGANPYTFLDNIHTLETIKALHNNNNGINEDEDEFVESDVTFAEPHKIHAFESSDIIIQYSSQQVK